MELFNIGIPELLLILMVMLVVLGPTEMSASARKFARWMRRVTQSETWRLMRDTTDELRELPSQLMREAGLEEWQQQIAPGGRPQAPGGALKSPPPPPAVPAPTPIEPTPAPPTNDNASSPNGELEHPAS